MWSFLCGPPCPVPIATAPRQSVLQAFKRLYCAGHLHQPPGKLLSWKLRPESPGKEQGALCRLGNALGFLSLALSCLRACILALLGEPVFTGCSCHQCSIWHTEAHSLAFCGEPGPCLWVKECVRHAALLLCASVTPVTLLALSLSHIHRPLLLSESAGFHWLRGLGEDMVGLPSLGCSSWAGRAHLPATPSLTALSRSSGTRKSLGLPAFQS